MSNQKITSVPQIREKTVQNYAAIVFGVAIAVVGAGMMTLTSSPLMKGAAFLWLPAALQLMAGVWLGPIRGFLAGGIGAYAAGIIAYQGWGIPDIIMNPIAGGLANSLLPALLFRWFKINPDFGSSGGDLKKAAIRVFLLLITVFILAFFLKLLGLGLWGYLPPLVFLIAAPMFLTNLHVEKRDFTLAFFFSVVICFISAAIGVVGVMVAGQTLQAAILGTGIGWFLGDTVSCILGLYVMASFTDRARKRGICSL
jgi:MFS family permease